MRPATASTLALARDREAAAVELEAAIAALGVAHDTYQRVTRELDGWVGGDLARRLDIPIVLALVDAGLDKFLERKLVVHGERASLQSVVEEQHERLALTDR